MRYLILTPIDSWFFRDGRPFHKGEATSDVGGLFPPSAFTVVGAIRAHLARSMGWHEGSWSDEICRVLGDGYDLGGLRFRGPMLCRESDRGLEMLFPAPLNLFGKKSDRGYEMRLLRPGAEIECDLGRVRLPAAENIDGMKPISGYITGGQLKQVLRGEVPDGRVIPADELWSSEYAVGLARESETRTAKEAHLYSINRVRLERGVHLLMGVEGIDDLLRELAGAVMPLGGEGRMASVDIASPVDDISGFRPELRAASGRIRFTLVHITPAFLGRWPGPGEGIPGAPGRVVSACIERARRIGGWDSVSRRPVELKPFIPPGSVWFCEADEGELNDIMSMSRVGDYTEFGFGEVAVGVW
ncbi:MAG: type III-B CRISPR module-associated protein Cmr3 [Methanothrix sp.]|nr:type III-B CRISPR module-associated protein Cmr3 [Methanothrix sp.]MCX8207739.1 type III-B CRISPR module-associated protein Cmr3 [Methanothrix sp.]